MAVTAPAKLIMPFKKCLIVSLQDYNAFFFLLLFWRHRVKCGDWKRPQTGVEPAPSAVELWSPKCWTLREVPTAHFPCCFCQSLRCVPTLWDPMDCSKPGFPVLHYLPKFAQTHVQLVNDAIQPSHSLSSPSPPTFNLSQHQGLFQWVRSSHQVVKVLELQLQSFQWIFRTDFL